MLVLQGDKGSGKTHLAHVFKERLNGQALIFDDVDAALSRKADYLLEQNIFHAYNRFTDSKTPLLLTSVLPPAGWDIKVSDLSSRVAGGPRVRHAGVSWGRCSTMRISPWASRPVSRQPARR